jgi:hypothetical protein
MTTLDPTLLPALNAIESVLNRPRQLDRRQVLNSMQKLDYEMRLRHYPAVFESEGRDAREFFESEQSPSDASFR